MRPGFTERQFEFCYNCEFVSRMNPRVIGYPYLPSLREEFGLGYDVRFELFDGIQVYSLFLQHKVSNFVTRKSPKNGLFRTLHGGDYYWFYLERLTHTQQHNLLYDLANSGESVFYCAPTFHTQSDLSTFFRMRTLFQNCCWFNPLLIGRIRDNYQHKITYSIQPSLLSFFHSKPKKIPIHSWEGQHKEVLSPITFTKEYLNALDSKMLSFVGGNVKQPFDKDVLAEIPVMARVATLAKYFFGVDWILVPAENRR